MKRVAALLLCAGLGSRARTFKPLAEFEGESFLSKVYRSLSDSGSFSEILVVTGFSRDRLEPELKRLGARSIDNPDYALGMHRSIRVGLESLAPGWDAALIALVDQPQLEASHYHALVEAYQCSELGLARPQFGGEFGNPCILAAKYLPEILAEPDSDRGCAYLFKRHGHDVLNVAGDSDRYLIDFDLG